MDFVPVSLNEVILPGWPHGACIAWGPARPVLGAAVGALCAFVAGPGVAAPWRPKCRYNTYAVQMKRERAAPRAQGGAPGQGPNAPPASGSLRMARGTAADRAELKRKYMTELESPADGAAPGMGTASSAPAALQVYVTPHSHPLSIRPRPTSGLHLQLLCGPVVPRVAPAPRYGSLAFCKIGQEPA
jgi:hypothetical protein